MLIFRRRCVYKALLYVSICMFLIACLAVRKKIILNNQLIDAVWHDNTLLIKTSLRDGASPNAQVDIRNVQSFKYKWASLFSLSNADTEPVILFVIRSSVGEEGRYHIIPALKLLVNAGANPNVRYPEGTTLLMQAVNYDDTSIVDSLIDHGAVIDAANKRGETALMEATTWGHSKSLERLLDYHASVEARDCHGNTALMLASAYNQLDAVRILLAHGASVQVRNYAGQTPRGVVGKRSNSVSIMKTDIVLQRQIINVLSTH